jgi:hypothetical protein
MIRRQQGRPLIHEHAVHLTGGISSRHRIIDSPDAIERGDPEFLYLCYAARPRTAFTCCSASSQCSKSFPSWNPLRSYKI